MKSLYHRMSANLTYLRLVNVQNVNHLSYTDEPNLDNGQFQSLKHTLKTQLKQSIKANFL